MHDKGQRHDRNTTKLTIFCGREENHSPSQYEKGGTIAIPWHQLNIENKCIVFFFGAEGLTGPRLMVCGMHIERRNIHVRGVGGS